jgi:hypothetical protein
VHGASLISGAGVEFFCLLHCYFCYRFDGVLFLLVPNFLAMLEFELRSSACYLNRDAQPFLVLAYFK